MENMRILHRKIRIEGLKKHYTFLHITDTHIACFEKTETAVRAEYAKERRRAFSIDGIAPEKRLQTYIEYANEARVSGVLLTGDIIDFPSPENLAVLDDALAALKVPYVYTPGNHDWSYFDNYQTEDAVRCCRPLLRRFCCGDEDFHVRKVGELTFAALDNSMDVYRPQTDSRLKALLGSAEHVIILQHVPLYCNTLHEDTVKVWKRDITMGQSGIVLDESADRITELLTAAPSVRAILCGHLHFSHEDLVGGVLPQYITAFGSLGEAALFDIGG